MERTTYKTRQRADIIDCLRENSENGLTVEALMKKLSERGTPVGTTTVYRYVEALVKEGVVRRFPREGKKSVVLQYVENPKHCGEHVHLQCKNCGKFVHLGCECMKEANEHLFKDHGFKIDNEKTVLVGLCADCLKGENKNGSD